MVRTTIAVFCALAVAGAFAGAAQARGPTHACGTTAPSQRFGTSGYVSAGIGTSCRLARQIDNYVMRTRFWRAIDGESAATRNWYELHRHRIASGFEWDGRWDYGGSVRVVLHIYE